MEQVPRITTVDDAIIKDMMDNQRTDHIEVHNRINTLTSSVLSTSRQPPGECDPESDLPCHAMPKKEIHGPTRPVADACNT